MWSVGTQRRRFGTSSGQFYATPAVAYGRVYIGNTDSNVYSFSAASGKLAWRTGTGGYVYASAAVAQVPGGKPTVYVGSYDARFYALDAKSGKVRWKHKAPGRISGAATVVGDIVYFGDLKSRTTTGLGARTGRKVVPLRPRRLQPRRLRRAHPLRGRLRVALAAQADGPDPHRHPRRGEVVLELGDRVAPVVEDRGEQHGVGARLEAVDEVLGLARRRPRR